MRLDEETDSSQALNDPELLTGYQLANVLPELVVLQATAMGIEAACEFQETFWKTLQQALISEGAFGSEQMIRSTIKPLLVHLELGTQQESVAITSSEVAHNSPLISPTQVNHQLLDFVGNSEGFGQVSSGFCCQCL